MTQPWTPWTNVTKRVAQMPGWVPASEQARVASYLVYDQMFWNDDLTYALMARGTDLSPLYVPEPRVIVETINRFTAPDLGFKVDPTLGSASEQALATQAFTNLFARERIPSRYASNKRFGLVRGDWVWHLTANPMKPEGSRLKLMPVHPGNYFPIREDPNDPDHITKVHLAERIVDDEGKAWVRRQTYERDPNSGQIVTSLLQFEEDKWLAGTGSVVVIIPPTLLDERITAFPVYQVPNFDEPGNYWGSSELRGYERITAGLTQSMTDEDLALALEGLGVYWTETAKKPKDSEGNDVDWTIFPGKVLQGAAINRVKGVDSVVPFGDHMTRMKNYLREAAGIGNVAVGRVDVSVAESGIALTLEMAPTLAKSAEKTDIIKSVHAQLMYDLRAWFEVFEGINLQAVSVTPTFRDPLPINKRGEVELVALLMSTDPPLMSAATARVYLASKGIEFDSKEADLVIAEQAAITAARTPADAFGARVDSEPTLDEE